MRLRHGLLAAALLAVMSLFATASRPVLAAGLFDGFPAAATPLTGNECIPADTRLGQGINPATECVQPGQITGLALSNPIGVHSNIPIGSVAYGSLGTDTTPVSGTIYFDSLVLPLNKTITGIACLNGSAASTNALIYALYDRNGARLATTSLSGTTASGTNAFQQIAFTATYAAKAGRYYVAYQTNGTTTRLRTIAASTYLGVATSSVAGTFGTLPALTIPTTFTADVGPICYAY